MSVVIVLLGVLLVVTVVLCGLLAYRLQQLRSAGSAALLRTLPAAVDEGWRHGTVHYTDESLRYFRLTSLRPGPSRTLCRGSIDIVGRREPAGSETEILSGMTILHLRETRQDGARGGPGATTDLELAMSRDGVTAFQAWLEAGAPTRAQRRRG
ncbi:MULTISPECIES: DUF2550 domain-containing protein [unclassified Gordonia (in: high G+C Gram-positive bacteria)]